MTTIVELSTDPVVEIKFMTFIPPEFKHLDEKNRAAKLGTSKYYSAWFKQQADQYHQEAHTWKQEKLEKFFKEGLLYYYIGKISSLNFELYYQQKKDEKWKYLLNDKNHFTHRVFTNHAIKKTDQDIDSSQAIVWLDILEQLYLKFFQNELLMALGAQFQKLKQENELLLNKKNSTSQSKDSILYQNDSNLEAIQTIIYNWVWHFHEEVKFFLQQQNFNIDRIYQQLYEFVPVQIPEFITERYADLLTQIFKISCSDTKNNEITVFPR